MVGITLFLPLLLGGCDNVEAWLSRTFATNKRVDALEKKIDDNAISLSKRIIALETASTERPKGAESLSYDDCVLAHIKDVTSDVAAVSIKISCMNKVSVPVDVGRFQESTAVYGKIFAVTQENGLGVHFSNDSAYTLTSIAFDIQEKKSGRHPYYWLDWFGAPNSIYSQTKDDTSLRMLTPGEHYLGVAISELPTEPKKFFDEYNWNILQAKGFMR